MSGRNPGRLMAMPLVVMNMGAEMVYILEQRLQAQSIPTDKSSKVLTDVLQAMYSPKFVAELFKPQPAYSLHATRQIFDRLAHSSIMRLNPSSMEKLFDLMTMGFKLQLLCCKSPHELLQVTLNHLESLKGIVHFSDTVCALIDHASRLAIDTYGTMPHGELYLLRQTLCAFLQDRRVKVSLFLQEHLQRTDGCIVLNYGGAVPVGSMPPGTVTYYDSAGRVSHTSTVAVLGAAKCTPASTAPPLDPVARPCKLGVNLYSKTRPYGVQSHIEVPQGAAADAPKAPVRAPAYAGAPAPRTAAATAAETKGTGAAAREAAPPARSTATAELNLLASLLGAAAEEVSTHKPLQITFVADDPIFGSAPSEPSTSTVTIDAKAHHDRMSAEMNAKFRFDEDPCGAAKDDGEDDLLSLMDQSDKL